MNLIANGRRAQDRTANMSSMNAFCGSVELVATDIPLRARRDVTARLLAIPEWKEVPTEDLMALARKRNVHTVDRASAIAVLQGARGL